MDKERKARLRSIYLHCVKLPYDLRTSKLLNPGQEIYDRMIRYIEFKDKLEGQSEHYKIGAVMAFYAFEKAKEEIEKEKERKYNRYLFKTR